MVCPDYKLKFFELTKESVISVESALYLGFDSLEFPLSDCCAPIRVDSFPTAESVLSMVQLR